PGVVGAATEIRPSVQMARATSRRLPASVTSLRPGVSATNSSHSPNPHKAAGDRPRSHLSMTYLGTGLREVRRAKQWRWSKCSAGARDTDMQPRPFTEVESVTASYWRK